jgi:hypothetical protein
VKRFLSVLVLVTMFVLPCVAALSGSWGKQLTFTTDPVRLTIPRGATLLSVYVISGSDVYVTVNRRNTNDFNTATRTNQIRIVSGAVQTFDAFKARGGIRSVSVAAESATSVVNLSAW